MVCQSNDSFQPCKAPPTISAHQTRITIGDTAVQAMQIVIAVPRQARSIVLQAHLDRFWIANYRDKRTGEAMVADHKMLHKIPIVRSAAETFLRGDQREGLHFVPRAI